MGEVIRLPNQIAWRSKLTPERIRKGREEAVRQGEILGRWVERTLAEGERQDAAGDDWRSP
jgi:hypothetical protein